MLEEYVLGKGIDALIKWYKKDNEGRDKRKEVLLGLKIYLKNIKLHMDLTKKFGHIIHKDLRFILPNDIELINTLLIKNQALLDNEIYNQINAFIELLVEYNEKINSPTMGSPLTDYDNKIMEAIAGFTESIDKLLSED